MARKTTGYSNENNSSVVNKLRKTLKGPLLLHKLLTTAFRTGDDALDFAHADGRRTTVSYQSFHSLIRNFTAQILSHAPEGRSQQWIIPVILPQSPELYVAWVAVLQAGAGFCPISIDVPSERLKFIVKDVDASLVIVLPTDQHKLRDLVPDVTFLPFSVPHLEVDQEKNGDGHCFDVERASIDPDGPAYVMYTSGSTGLPKGVKVSHRSVTQSLLAHDEHIPNFRRFLQFASPTFDVSIFEVFFPLFRGATLVSRERERMLSDLPGTIQLLKADAAELTPTVAGTLLRKRAAAPTLRVLLTIGEMLTRQVVDEFGGSTGRESMLYALYGPTEAAIHCTIAPRLAASASVRSIGRPLSTVTAIILKDSARSAAVKIAPIGEPGELAIVGQLASGYLNRPEQNEAAFFELPGFGRVYRTGDRALCRKDGQLEILGRMSAGQVKLRGQRVELGEIEEVACKVKGVDLAIASVINDLLVLFCLVSENVTSEQIRSTCRSWLPKFMLPGEVVLLADGLPRLPSGKVDRKALENGYSARARTLLNHENFSDNLQRELAAVIGAELQQSILPNSELWASGLDSLRAIKIASTLRKRFPGLNAVDLMESETVVELASKIRTAYASAENGSRHSLSGPTQDAEWTVVERNIKEKIHAQVDEDLIQEIQPCTEMQIAMLADTVADRSLYFNTVEVRFRQDLDTKDIWNALAVLAECNEILRSGFVATDDPAMPFVQIVWKELQRHALDLLHPIQVEEKGGKATAYAVFRIHHALYDGWSWELILADLNKILSGRQPDPRPSFKEFLIFQRHAMAQHRPHSYEYWAQTLGDLISTPFPRLTTAKNLPPSRGRCSRVLSVSPARLSDIASAHRISRQSIFQAGWAILLSLYTDCADVVFGSVSSGRNIPVAEVENIIGPCLSTFPLRIDLATVHTVEDLLQYVQRILLAHLKFHTVSPGDLKKAAGFSPKQRLFDSLCVWQESLKFMNEHHGLIETVDSFDSLDHPIVLEIEPGLNQLLLKITFDTSLIPEQHAVLLIEQLDYIINRMIHCLDLDISAVPAAMPEALRSSANSVPTQFDKSFGLISGVERTMKNSPQRPAIEFVHDFDLVSSHITKETLSYEELHRRSSKLSFALQEMHQIQSDDLVCIFAPKSIDLYVCIFAVIMSGAGYMCIDPQTPAGRVTRILFESNCKLVIYHEFVPLLPNELDTSMVSVRALSNASDSCSGSERFDVDRMHLAYTVFTSGSTGTPKGVQLTRTNLMSNLDCLSRIYPSQPESDRLLQSCSPAFDVSVFEIFWTWHMGMTLCAASNDVLFRDLEKFIDRMGITHLSMTPSVAALVDPNNVPQVKMLVTAGEPMNSRVFSAWAGRGLYQGYGPSETTNICNVRPQVTNHDFANNVGPPFANTSIFVCKRSFSSRVNQQNHSALSESDFQLVPKGAVGEIWVGGDQVGRGYVDPLLTAKSFLDHPLFGRLYRSGDIGRILADDSLVVLGREDDQIKLRGQRIELGEISATLISNPLVKDAVSVVIDEGDRSRLICFWTEYGDTGKDEDDHATAKLFQHVESHLPTYMVPDMIILVGNMPLTRQGKVDKRALIEHYQHLDSAARQNCSRDSSKDHDQAPMTGDEMWIAEAVSHVLDIPMGDISCQSSFYGLGLDSVSCIRLSQRLRELQLGQFDVSTILRHPSIRQLSQFIQQNGEESHIERPSCRDLSSVFDKQWRCSIVEKYQRLGLHVEKFLPCTPLQEFMLSQTDGFEAGAYRNTLVFNVRGDISRLREAWIAVAQNHQLLRTGFVMTPSTIRPYAQVVLHNPKVLWYEGESSAFQSESAETLMIPPFKITINQEGSQRKTLRIDVHHALYDARAISLLLQEVEHAYRGHMTNATITFDHYLRYMVDLDNDEVDHFWGKVLAGVKPCSLLQILDSNSLNKGGKPVTITYVVDGSNSKIQDFVRRESTTVLALVEAVWARILACYYETGDVCFGNVYSGRNVAVEGVETIIGPCFNTLPVRVSMKRHESNRDLYQKLQHYNLDVLPLQPSPLRRIQRLVKGGTPLFDSLVLVQQEDRSLDQSIWALEEDVGDMGFPFILEAFLDFKKDDIAFHLHSQISDELLLKQILDNFVAILDHTVQFPQARCTDFTSIENRLPSLKHLNSSSFTSDASLEGTEMDVEIPDQLSPTESRIRDIMLQMSSINRQHVLKTTTIFQLGLDSINAVQIAARLRDMGYTISGADILERPSIEQIAATCESTSTDKRPTPQNVDLTGFDQSYRTRLCDDLDIDQGTVETVRPCSPTQSGILASFLRSSGSVYLNSMTLLLETNVDLGRLRAAWTDALSAHEMLRTGFAPIEDGKYPFALITYKFEKMKLPWYELPRNGEEWVSHSPLFRHDLIQELRKPPWCLRVIHQKDGPVLEISMLHALYDAQSLDLILASVSARYNGQKMIPAPPIGPTLCSILTASAREEGAREFWTTLGAEIQHTRFPDMRIYNNRSTTLSMVSGKLSLTYNAIEKRCADLGISTQVAFQAAWSKLLSAYTNQQSVTFGLILSGRVFDNEEQNQVVFPCINTVPFTIRVPEDSSELLNQISKRNPSLAKHQFTPLPTIKRWLGLEGDIFDTILVLQKFESKRSAYDPWQILDDRASAEYAISVEVLPNHSGTVTLQLTFGEGIVPEGQAKWIMQSFDRTLLEVLSMRYETTLSESALSALPPKDERIETHVKYLHQFVEESASKHPHRIALEFVTDFENNEVRKQAWSFAELESKGNEVAQILVQKGSKQKELIAICFEKCPEASFAILGIMKAGCAFVAIDPAAPDARKHFILDDAGCRILLTTRDRCSEFGGLERIQVVPIDDPKLMDGLPRRNVKLPSEIDVQDACYCLYTSGTTGTPKGCLISHDSAVQAMLSFQRIFSGRWSSQSRWLQFASFHFDVSVLEQYWSWSVGICVTSAPRDLLFEDLPGTIRALGITHLDLTPSLARLLTPEDVPSLCEGVFIVGGEQVGQDILDTWGDTRCLYNFYGPSEVTIGCTVHPHVAKDARPTNIGRQWDNVGAFVLRPGSEMPVLRGAVGELCLSGPLVGKGYLNRPDLTCEKFVTLTKYKTRVYRTGDVVRLLHDNSFDFLGRIDDQVKLRGQRLEIGEINHVVIGAARQIKHAATLILKHPGHGKDQLVAFFSTGERCKREQRPILHLDDADVELKVKIRNQCLAKLPGYMVPAYFLRLSFMPLSTNNKVDHKVLRSLFESITLADVQPTSPNGVRQRSSDGVVFSGVSEVLADFLHIERSRIRESSTLFEIGLDSISVIGLSRRLKRKGFASADVSTIMKHPVINDLCDILAVPSSELVNNDLSEREDVERTQRQVEDFARKHQILVATGLGLRESMIERILPCTPLQEGMIAAVMNSEGANTPYFAHFDYELDPETDVPGLERTWRSIQQQLEILRTRFVTTPDGFAQAVVKDECCPIVKEILRYADDNITWVMHKDFLRWMDEVKGLASAPPWQVVFYEDKAKAYMSLRLFHGLYDGTSLPLLLDAFLEVHLGSGKSQAFEAPKFHDILAVGPLCSKKGAKEFWKTILHTSETQGFPLQSTRRQAGEGPEIFQSTIIVQETLSSLSSKLNVTIPAIFQAAWIYTLFEKFGVNPTLGIVVSGRALHIEGADKVIGPLFNTIPCIIDGLTDDSKAYDLIQKCHQFNVDVIPYQHTPLRAIAKWKGFDLKNLFTSLFVFQKEQKMRHEQNPLWADMERMPAIPDYPLNIEVEQKCDDTFVITIITKGGFLCQDDLLNLGEHVRKMIERIAEGDDLTLSDDFCKRAGGAATSARQQKLSSPSLPKGVSESGSRPAIGDWSGTAGEIREQLAILAGVEQSMIDNSHPTIFELGLDSIDTLKLAARLKNIGLLIPAHSIMRYPTVQGIAEHVTDNVSSMVAGDCVTTGSSEESQEKYRELLQRQGVDISSVLRILPVTPMQEGLLADADKYYYTFTFALDPLVDSQKIVDAWKTAVQVHPILRISFACIEDVDSDISFVQMVHDDGAGPDFTLQETIEPRDLCVRIREAASTTGLSGQTMQLAVAAPKSGKRFLVLGMPHAMYDAWSFRLLHRDIAGLYFNPSYKPEASTIAYERHIADVWQQAKSSETHQFWKQNLRDVQSTIFPPDILTSGNADTNDLPATLIRSASQTPLSDVQKFCKINGVTLSSLGLACLALILCHRTQQLDVCFGLILSGRITEGSESLVFPTFNTVIFRHDVRQHCTKESLVRKVHEQAMEINENQSFPLRKAVKIGKPTGKGAAEDLFNTLFTFQKGPEDDPNLDVEQLYHELNLDPEGDGAFRPPYAINIEMEAKHGQLWWTVAVQEGVLSQSGVSQVLQDLDHVLREILRDPKEGFFIEEDTVAKICALSPVVNSNSSKALGESVPDEISECSELGVDSEETWTETESKIRDALARIAKTDTSHIKKDTGYFYLGLDSISAIKVSGLLRHQGIKLPVSEIIRSQTVARMAKMVRIMDRSEPATASLSEDRFDNPTLQSNIRLEEVGLKESDVESMLPATAGQIYMLNTWLASGGRLFYPTFWLEAENVSKQVFTTGVTELMRHIPLLRTVFVRRSDSQTSIVQITIRPEAMSKIKFPWEVSMEELHDKLLIKLKIHHALYDAVSLQLMVDALRKLCQEPRQALNINVNLASCINMVQADRDTREAKDFWTQYLDSLHSTNGTFSRGTFAAARVEHFERQFLQSNLIEAQLKKQGVSIQALFFAVCGKVYASQMQREQEKQVLSTSDASMSDVVIGVYLANRSHEVENLPTLIAPTFSIVPLRVKVAECTILESAKKVQDDLALVGKAGNCGASLEQIYEWTGIRIKCMVNFIRVPKGGDDEEEEHEGRNDCHQVVIRHADANTRELSVAETDGEATSPFLGTSDARDLSWCLVSCPLLYG